jgi:hypothetical protein
MPTDNEYWELLQDGEEYHEELNYDVASRSVIEVFTPTSRVRLHDPDDRVVFEREKREENKITANRQAERIFPVLPGPRR